MTNDQFELGTGQLTRRNILGLVSALLAAKIIVFAAFYSVSVGHFVSLHYLATPQAIEVTLNTLGSDWDGFQYQLIASVGFPSTSSELYVFSPAYPVLLYGAHFLTGSYSSASLLVTNSLSFIFPVVLLRLFGFRAALLAEMFPVYIVYTMVGYSDVLALIFLGLALLCYVRGSYLLSGISLSLAGLVLYDLLIVSVAFAGYMVLHDGQARATRPRLERSLLSFLSPVIVTGISILVAYWAATGDPFTFFKLEHAYWGVAATTPLGQIEWVLTGTGLGSFSGTLWNVFGIAISPTYWVVRNALFEAFFLLGAYLLSRMKECRYRWLLVSFSLVLSVPLFFVQGTPVYSIPRLLLAAFPVFYGYSSRVFTKNWQLVAYAVISTIAAVWILTSFYYAFFA